MKELTKTLLKAYQLDARLSKRDADEQSLRQLRMWGAGVFRLVVMGEIKKGKSSFINALLGEPDLVPISSNVATSTIFKIRYGSEKGYRVYFYQSTGKQSLPISSEQLDRYGTEQGNPDNQLGVEFIEVVYPSPLLKTGVVIIDTPGLGGLHQSHKKVTWQYVPRADAVFFVTDSIESALGYLELDYLKALREVTPHLYFVQTKSCVVDQAARESRKAKNLSILSTLLECPSEQIPYFTVDSKLRFEAQQYKDLEDLEESGYPSLLAYINSVLKEQQNTILAQRMIQYSLPTLTRLKERRNALQQLLACENDAMIAELKEKLLAKQRDLQEWQSSKQGEILASLQKSLQNSRLEAMAQMNKCRPSGEIQSLFEERIHDAADVESLQLIINEITAQLPTYFSEVLHEIAQQMRSQAQELLQSYVDKSSQISSIPEIVTGSEMSNLGGYNSLNRVQNLSADNDSFNTIKNTMYGGLAGVTFATIAGGIIGSVIPVVGTAIGSYVGITIAGMWGSRATYKHLKDQELKSAKQQSQAALSQAISSMYTKASAALERMIFDLNNDISSRIQSYIKQTVQDTQAQIVDLRDRGQLSSKQLQERKKELALLESELASYQRVIHTSSLAHQ